MKVRVALLALVSFVVLSFAVSDVGHAVDGGSISLNGTNQYVSVPGSSDWAVGTGDFTVEWFQYQTSFSSAWPRIFSVGSYPSTSIGVSIEGGTIYVWLAGAGPRLFASAGSISNQWVHFAVTRSGTTLRIFKNGVQLASGTNSTNVTNSSTPLYVGSEGTSGTYFGGLITNFHFVKGTALYTSAFTPSGPLSAVADTKLLLQAVSSGSFLSDSSGLARTVNGVSTPEFNWGTPFPWTGNVTPTSSPATAPPATTTTTSTSTTTTTVPATTTTVPITTTTVSAGSGSSGAGQTPIGTSPILVTTTTIAASRVTATTTTIPRLVGALGVSTTTALPTTTTTTTTTIPAPNAPSVKDGEAAALVGGKPIDVDLQRLNNDLILTIGTAKVVISAMDSSEGKKGLSASGGLELEPGDSLSFRAEGFSPLSEAEFWIFSEPTRVGSATANDAGRLTVDVEIPSTVEPGSHRFVVSAKDAQGKKFELAVGLQVVTEQSNNVRWQIIFALVVLIGGALMALFLPSALRRRRV